MATPASPLTGGGNPIAAVLAALAQRQGGAGGQQAPGAGQDYAKQSADLQGADPGMLLRQVEQLEKLMGVMFVQTFQRLPNAANQLSKTMSQLSRVKKELQQAAGVQSAMPKPEISQSLVTSQGGPGADSA